MNRSQFAAHLRTAVIAALCEFRSAHPDDTPYGFALIPGQAASYLRYAIATEQGLRRVAADYYTQYGYRYEAFDWETADDREKLAVYLRWANPDDGWFDGDFPERFQIPEHLETLVKTGAIATESGDLEEFCSDEVLASLPTDPAWQIHNNVIVGVTYGEDPRDFLRTATRSNPYAQVSKLWREQFAAEGMAGRIKRFQ